MTTAIFAALPTASYMPLYLFAVAMFVIGVLPPSLLIAAVSRQSFVPVFAKCWTDGPVGAISLALGAAMAVFAWLRVAKAMQPVQRGFLVRTGGWLLLVPSVAGTTSLLVLPLGLLMTAALGVAGDPSLTHRLLVVSGVIAAVLAAWLVPPTGHPDLAFGSWIDHLNRSVRRSSLVLVLVTGVLLVVSGVAWLLMDKSDWAIELILGILAQVLACGLWMAASASLSLAWSRRLSPLPDPPPRSVRRRLARTV